MQPMIKKIAIVHKDSEEGKNASQKALEILNSYNIEAFVLEPNFLMRFELNRPFTEKMLKETQCVLVLGGDGTLLAASRLFSKVGVPVLGVNIGGLGFITSIPFNQLETIVQELVSNNFVEEERTMIKCKIDGPTHSGEYHALNDVVIHKGGALARIIDLKVSIDGEELTTFRADGLIISTPTGSTAYNLSAGGPIVSPSLNTFIITPICPFTLTNRPLIVSDETVIEIGILKDREESVTLTVDGQVGIEFKFGDRVRLSKSEYHTTLIRPRYYSFYKVLKHKLGWGGTTPSSHGTRKCETPVSGPFQ